MHFHSHGVLLSYRKDFCAEVDIVTNENRHTHMLVYDKVLETSGEKDDQQVMLGHVSTRGEMKLETNFPLCGRIGSR